MTATRWCCVAKDQGVPTSSSSPRIEEKPKKKKKPTTTFLHRRFLKPEKTVNGTKRHDGFDFRRPEQRERKYGRHNRTPTRHEAVHREIR
ncbi:unnamed protein product [Caenorhabditis auriculariae]|uniref:Uncharacterized protein n=1 Tax=Caenorhabditis auriculariae TaxID=2777116 RepID=A0A8S1HPZ2_9PELO|nr:unnamed protein product [Caenorhabditis auriculariae]